MATKKPKRDKTKKEERRQYKAEKAMVISYADNDFVESLSDDFLRISYTKDFYIVMYKYLNEGKTAEEAYELCGFKVKDLGENRAQYAAARARELGKQEGYTVNPDNYDGSVPIEMMGELTPQEMIAYQTARIRYLEEWVELEKKRDMILEEARISLAQEKLNKTNLK